MTARKVRVRFAPSPTGPLHLGGIRAALYNYLFAKQQGGDFILRIEDTDQTRFVPGAQAYIIEALQWCGIEPNEGIGFGEGAYAPYRQSDRQRQGIYAPYVDQLIKSGYAYYAFDTPEELEAMRERLERAKMIAAYNHITRQNMKNSLTLPKEEVEKRLKSGENYVVRIQMPKNEEIRFHDEIRGWIVVNSDTLDDKVLCKSDGMPTYHLANVVDDYLMDISHVIRGEEWLPSCPLHVLMYRYFGWEDKMPKFAHLPLILKPDGNGKLSKRDGDRLGFSVFPLTWKNPETGEVSIGYRERGFFPAAFINMLAFLGWHPGGNALLLSKEEMIQQFSLARVGKSGAKFDADKANWFNQEYLRLTDNYILAKEMAVLLENKGIQTIPSQDKLAQIAKLMKERAQFIPDLVSEDYFFAAPKAFEAQVLTKKWHAQSAALLKDFTAALTALTDWQSETVEKCFKDFIIEKNTKLGEFIPIFRLALTGKGTGPSLFDIASILGKQEVLQRIQHLLEQPF